MCTFEKNRKNLEHELDAHAKRNAEQRQCERASDGILVKRGVSREGEKKETPTADTN